jgi:hypothetical protein
MKKIVYLLSALMLVFTACDPMEDVYEELDKAAAEKPDATVVNKTLVTTDYQFFKTPAPAVAARAAFSSEDEAIELLPAFVASKFPQLNNGAIVNVTFNQALYPTLTNTVSSNARVTVSNTEYTALGETNNRFDSETSDLAAYLAYKYPTPADRQLVAVTYKVVDPADATKSITMKDSFLYMNGAWMNIYHVSDEEYAATGNGQFKNFDVNSDANLISYFNQFLKNYYMNKNMVAKIGDVQYVSYTYFGGGTNQKIAAMVYNGTNWIEAQSQFTTSTLKFKKNEGEWNVDLTVSYTLVNADYTWIGKDNPAPNYGSDTNRPNLNQFRSYFTQIAGDPRYWSQEEIDKSLVAFIKYKYPNPKEGVKFQIFYKIYNGATVTVSATFEKDENGEYKVIART